MTIQVFEHQKLLITENGAFQKRHYEALSKFNEKHKSKFFTVLYNGIKFSHYVGVLQVGKLTIEILPKADKTTSVRKWQRFLIDMLQSCRLLKIESLSQADLSVHPNSLLELYFEVFLNEVETLLRHGLIRQYYQEEKNIKNLKGRLLPTQHFTKNIVHQERFYTVHGVYQFNHIFHQILAQALSILKELIVKPRLKNKLGQILLRFPEVTAYQFKAKDFEKIRYTRKTLSYQTAIEIAQLLILNYSPHIKSGKQSLLAILFDMNQLFEQYIFRCLKKLEGHYPIKVQAQETAKFWNNQSIRPDIVLSVNGEKYVIDTKWKILETLRPASDDLKQMYVYNHYFEAQRSLLLYPKTAESHEMISGDFHKSYYRNEEMVKHGCNLGFIEIVRNGRLNQRLGVDILEMF